MFQELIIFMNKIKISSFGEFILKMHINDALIKISMVAQLKV